MAGNQPSVDGLERILKTGSCGEQAVPAEDYALRCPVCAGTDLFFNQNYSLVCSDCGSTASAAFT